MGVLAVPVFAQDETLISGPVESGGFGGPMVKLTTINGENAVLVGGRGGWIINRTFVIGGGGFGLVTNVNAKTPDATGQKYLELGYGGLDLEYIRSSNELVHFSMNLLIGGGGVAYKEEEMSTGHREMDGFFVLEPGIHVNLNVTQFFRIALGATYRYVTGVDTPVDSSGMRIPLTSNADLSGPSAVLTLEFGKF